MKLIRLSLAITMVLISIGCSSINKAPVPKEKSDGKIWESNPEVYQTTEEKADFLVQTFIKAINKKDEETLTDVLKNESFGLEHIKPALEDYNVHFKGQIITEFKRKGPAPYMVDTFLYDIYADNGISHEVIVNFQNEKMKIYDEFFTYSYSAHYLIENFVKYIQQRDANKLADLLNPDDLPYPVSNAKIVISNYERIFNISTLGYQFSGIEPKENRFKYVLFGYKGKEAVEHVVYINFGDSLVGLRDQLVP